MYLGERVSSSFVRNVAVDDLSIKASRGEILVDNTNTAKVARNVAQGGRKATPVLAKVANKLVSKVEEASKKPEIVKEIVYVDRIVEKEVFVPVPVENTESNFFDDYVPEDMVSDVMSRESEKVQ